MNRINGTEYNSVRTKGDIPVMAGDGLSVPLPDAPIILFQLALDKATK